MSGRTHVADPGAVLSYALRLLNREGFDRVMAVRALMADEQVLELQRRSGPNVAFEFVNKTIDKAMIRIATHPAKRDRSTMVADITEARSAADERPWRGKAGPTDRRVLEGGYITAYKAKSMAFGCSYRTWSLRAGLDTMTVWNSVQRLVRLGALRVLDRGDPGRRRSGHFAVANLRPDAETGSSLPPETLSVPLPEQVVPVEHDAFRPSALGSSSWFVLRRLNQERPLPVRDLLAVLGISRTPMYQTLRQLRQHDLVRPASEGWVAVPDTVQRLDRAAQILGTAGSLERDRLEIQRQREKDRSSRPLSVSDGGLQLTTLERALVELVARQRHPEEVS